LTCIKRLSIRKAGKQEAAEEINLENHEAKKAKQPPPTIPGLKVWPLLRIRCSLDSEFASHLFLRSSFPD
jgi:hypothetical protein